MYIKTRYMARDDWSRIEERRSAYMEAEFFGIKGFAGLLCLDKVKAPLVKGVPGVDVKIVDNGFRWLQFAPKGEHWWLTVMADERGKIVQYYFDITKENVLCEESSYFYDLFLDVVALPDGTVVLLDKDELDAALSENIITENEYKLAINTADILIRKIPENIGHLEQFCYKLFDEMSILL
ncbi:MAG: DUF402 domain-containing protein [Oscillospiraceae bacterium]|nr:DUF402 domain-containing protein [Oscillospiraceae bacterium]